MRMFSFAATWVAIKALVGGLGGLAGIKMIYDFLTRGAKLKLFWLRDISFDAHNQADDAFMGGVLLVMIDVVNLRQHPVCIRNWDLEVHSKGKVLMARRWLIRDEFKFPTPSGDIDMSKERLAEKSFHNPVEYGKPMRGWLGFHFPKIKREEATNNVLHYVFVAEDAFGKKHRIKTKRPPSTNSPDAGNVYFEGSGQRITTPVTFHFDSTISRKPQT
ncbi:MAG: hypothetical protein JWM83_2995 [Candidatus Angelobacter sp.]|nr:hypothetical protein [Candidatus Angelobacter sp.]